MHTRAHQRNPHLAKFNRQCFVPAAFLQVAGRAVSCQSQLPGASHVPAAAHAALPVQSQRGALQLHLRPKRARVHLCQVPGSSTSSYTL
jgi:hypothetical protein